MHNVSFKDIVLPGKITKGESVKIRVLTGPLSGKEFKANKTIEKDDTFYHIEDSGTKTYFSQKDIIEI